MSKLTLSQSSSAVRKELKRLFPTTAFRVTLRRSTVNVEWQDGPTWSAVQAAVGHMKDGQFDSMTDLITHDSKSQYSNTFISFTRFYSVETLTKAAEKVCKFWNVDMPVIKSGGSDAYIESNVRVEKAGEYLEWLVMAEAQKMSL